MVRKRGMSPEQAEQLRLRRGLDRGTRLRIVRVQKGLSQSELSEASGVTKVMIQRYEQEPHRIDNAKLNSLCDLSNALDCKISDILDSNELIERFKKVK